MAGQAALRIDPPFTALKGDARDAKAVDLVVLARRQVALQPDEPSLRIEFDDSLGAVELGQGTNQQVGGIIIPDTAKEKPQQGKVIAAGKGKIKDDGTVTPLDVKAGDTVLFGKYAGQEITIDGDELFIMREDDVLGVIEGS